jgi:hypothetical protein
MTAYSPEYHEQELTIGVSVGQLGVRKLEGFVVKEEKPFPSRGPRQAKKFKNQISAWRAA